jgi:hypothetical protein
VPKRADVGRSRRTPAKHALMSSMIGREVGVVNNDNSPKHRLINRLDWMDLTAGDAAAPPDEPWHLNCSPGILAHHARNSRKPVDITLYEIKPATHKLLLNNLVEHLPALGYTPVAEGRWEYQGRVRLRAVSGSGAQADVSHLRREHDAVLVTNDPNAITDWAMRPTFAAEVNDRVWCFRSISTMGCNTSGLHRLDPEIRETWFDLIDQQIHALPSHRDLYLARIEGDASLWGYLLLEPVKFTNVKTIVRTAFGKYGYTMDVASLREEPGKFKAITDYLFLRHSERKAAS